MGPDGAAGPRCKNGAAAALPIALKNERRFIMRSWRSSYVTFRSEVRSIRCIIYETPEDSMTRLLVRCLCLAATLAALVYPCAAQTPTLPYDHIHLGVPDTAAAVSWYEKNFGGKRFDEAADRLLFGSTRLIFLRRDKSEPSVGSSIDHLGFSFANLDAKMKEFEAVGVKIV